MSLNLQFRRWWPGIVFGTLGTGLTLLFYAWTTTNPQRPSHEGLELLFAFGPLLTTIPYGGLHNAVPSELVFIGLGSLLNGCIWALVAGAFAYVVRGAHATRG